MPTMDSADSDEKWLIREGELKEVLFTMKNLFDEFNIKFVLRWGTCLGAMRDHRLLPWDKDLDILIPVGDCVDCNKDDRLLFYSAFREATEVRGLISDSAKRWKTIEDWNRCWDSRMTHIYNVPHVFWFKTTHVELYLGTNKHKPDIYFGELPKVTMYGCDFLVPRFTKEYLDDIYGKSWPDIYCSFPLWLKYKDDIILGKIPTEVEIFNESIEGWKSGQD